MTADDLELLNALEDWDYVAALERCDEPVEAIALFRATHAARKLLGDAEAAIADWAFEKVGYGTHEFPGGAVMIRKSSSRTEWEHDAVMSRALAIVADELGVTVRAVEEVLTSFRKLTQQPSWSTPGLKAAGVDPDEFCKKTPGRPTIQLM